MKANLILSHSDITQKMIGSPRGEIANSLKFHHLLSERGKPVNRIDIYSLFDSLNEFEEAAFLNCALAEQNDTLIESLPHLRHVHQKVQKLLPKNLFLFTWNYSLASLFAAGIHTISPTAAKLYVSHENENILPSLYQPTTLLLTESLLANQKGIESGIPPWKMIHLPHHTPSSFVESKLKPSYLEKALKKSGKNIGKNTCVIGTLSRLDYGKNIEFALEAIKALHEEGADILYILKGDFDQKTQYPVYRDWLQTLILSLQEEPWLLWDPTPTPFSQINEVYNSLDLFLHLSGKEAGSNVIVEALTLGIPSLILNASTNPSLFKNAALFVENDGSLPLDILRPFQIPLKNDLHAKLKQMIDNQDLRKFWGDQAKRKALERFSPQISQRRLPLIFEAMYAFYYRTSKVPHIQKKIENMYLEDLKRYA